MPADTHQLLVFDRVGDELGLTYREVPVPNPGPDEVRIKVAAFGLNQADILLMSGRHYVVSDLPLTLGYEAAGIVDAVGESVTRFRVGDRVSTLPNVDGPYSVAGEYALARESFTSAWPDGWSEAEACAFWMQYLTAYFPLRELFPVKPGDWLLITAASGGTGLGAIQVAKAGGARVIATSRTSAKREFLLAHGADAVVATDEEDLAVTVMELTDGSGASLINDTIGGGFVGRYVEALAYDGTIYIHGGLSGTNEVSFPIVPLVRRRGAVHGYSLINELRDDSARERGRAFVLDGLASKQLPRPVIDSVFSFDRCAEAYERMRTGVQRGKIVVRVE